jgi:hypothetical protein
MLRKLKTGRAISVSHKPRKIEKVKQYVQKVTCKKTEECPNGLQIHKFLAWKRVKTSKKSNEEEKTQVH